MQSMLERHAMSSCPSKPGWLPNSEMVGHVQMRQKLTKLHFLHMPTLVLIFYGIIPIKTRFAQWYHYDLTCLNCTKTEKLLVSQGNSVSPG